MAIARSVAIIGGGIGGLTVANSLKRLGLSVSLYERSPYFIATAGEKYRLHILTVNDNGEILHTTNQLSECGKRFGYFLGGTLRVELRKTDILHYSHNMIDMKQDGDGVRISFENEKQRKSVRVDMVIGADGIHSTVVKQIFSQTAPSIHSKENIFYGVIDNIDEQTSINPSITAKNTLTQYFGRGEFISYRVGNQGQFIWAATYPSDEPPAHSGDTEWIGINNQRESNRFLTRFPPSHPVHQCAAATNEQR